MAASAEKRLFFNAALGFGGNVYDQTRSMALLGQTANSKYFGLTTMVRIDGGYDIDAGPITITPNAGLQASRTMNRSYTESGSGALNLSIDRQAVNAVQSSLGASVSTSVASEVGEIKPTLGVSWLRDLARGHLQTTGSIGGVGFSTQSDRPLPNGLWIKAAIDLRKADELSFRLEYDGDLRGDYQSHSGLIKTTYRF